MWLWVSLGVAVIGGLQNPFAKRLQATGLWAGKAIVPSEARKALPRGVQDALTDGWPSMVSVIGSMTSLLAGIIGFFHAWWMGPAAFIIGITVAGASGRTELAPSSVERYLVFLLGHLYRRKEGHESAGDKERSGLAVSLAAELEKLVAIYGDTGVPAPTMTLAKEAPHGDPRYLLRIHRSEDGTPDGQK